MEQEATELKQFDSELARFVEEHRLPANYATMARRHFLPLANWLFNESRQANGNTVVAGVYGAQGSGKSTLADLLVRYIAAAGKNAVCLSLDDFYLTRQERGLLASDVSPLLETRGPPGTHDVELALDTVQRATKLDDGDSMAVPRFDKAIDDRVHKSAFDRINGPVDVVILEGWCLGCAPVTEIELTEPINDLERDEDADGSWRRYVNESIRRYQPLFDSIDRMIALKTPRFDAVLRWRTLQEDKLKSTAGSSGKGIMTGTELGRFVQLFERVSRNAEQQVPLKADVVITLDESHGVLAVHHKNRGQATVSPISGNR